MSGEKENNNLPARGGEFVHTFSKEGGWSGSGIAAVPFVLIAFLIFIVLAILMLGAGGVSMLLGKPAKIDFRRSFDASRSMFGKIPYSNPPGRDADVIDVEATEITEKRIDGL